MAVCCLFTFVAHCAIIFTIIQLSCSIVRFVIGHSLGLYV